MKHVKEAKKLQATKSTLFLTLDNMIFLKFIDIVKDDAINYAADQKSYRKDFSLMTFINSHWDLHIWDHILFAVSLPQASVW